MCLGALGSQTGGSITRPASYCGVAGCKPTFGRISVQGVLPLAPSLDHVGPMARCVRDLEILLHTVADGGWLSTTSSGVKPTLGRLRGLFESRADPVVTKMMDEVTDKLRQRGAIVEEVSLPASFSDVPSLHRTIMAVESAQFHQERLRRHPEDYDPWIRGLLEEGLATPAPEYARCKEHQAELREEMERCFDNVDALLTPATTGPAPDATSTGDPAFNSPWSYTGLPTICFPVGKSPDGLPLAIQLVGRPWGESELFPIAAWCEKAVGVDLGEPPAVA
jgi:aspartyl-tRNA(Asn)/glutamyl-tRNA(Gln) amidotransferase subunit A